MFFLTMSNANINFQAWQLPQKSYTIGDVFLTTRKVKLIEKKEFGIAALDLEHEAFIVYIAALNVDSGDKMHPSKKS